MKSVLLSIRDRLWKKVAQKTCIAQIDKAVWNRVKNTTEVVIKGSVPSGRFVRNVIRDDADFPWTLSWIETCSPPNDNLTRAVNGHGMTYVSAPPEFIGKFRLRSAHDNGTMGWLNLD